MNPKKVNNVDMAFGGIDGLMPDRNQIPDEVKRGDSWGNRLFNDWFYSGLTELTLTPREGIDKDEALRHIRTIMGSFTPKHEHKQEAVAYLLGLWFEPGTWKAKPFKDIA